MTYNQTMLIPVFAIFRSGNLTQKKADELFSELVTANTAKRVFMYLGIVVAALGGIGFALCFIKIKMISKRELAENKQNQEK
jgi:tetrahydromethanopterin S-methyltransferase subunit D